MASATARRRTVAFCSPAPRPATDHCVAPSAAADGQADCHHHHGSQQQRDGDPAAPHRRRHLGVARPDRAAAPAMPSRSCRSVGRPQGGRATLGCDSPRTDQHHGDDDAEDEAADVGEEPDAPPCASAPNIPKLASMSWYKEHRGDPADAPRLGGVAGVVNGAGIERGVRDRRPEVRELVEEPDREVGDDDRDVHDREAPRFDAVGQRKQQPSSSRRAFHAAIGGIADTLGEGCGV